MFSLHRGSQESAGSRQQVTDQAGVRRVGREEVLGNILEEETSELLAEELDCWRAVPRG